MTLVEAKETVDASVFEIGLATLINKTARTSEGPVERSG